MAGIWTYLTRATIVEAAIDLDERFQLKERVSSSLAMAEEDLAGEAGRALLLDAAQRIERVDVSDGFPIRLDWRSALPLVPAVIVFLLVFLPDAQQRKEAQAKEDTLATKQQIRTSTDELKKKVLQRRKKAEQLGMKDAHEVFKNLESGLKELRDLKDNSRRSALRKLSELDTELRKRRNAVGDAEDLKKQFSQLKNLKAGPAEKLAQHLKSGDYSKAIEALENLKQRLQQRDLTPEEQKKLAQQMRLMGEKLQQMVAAHRQGKERLQRSIDEARRRGDRDQVRKLQQKLDQMTQQNRQMQQLEKLAQKMSQCSQCMAQGQGSGKSGQGRSDLQSAIAQMDEISDQLQQMQDAMEELEMLDEALDEIALSKDAMNCGQCKGQGCAACNGMGNLNGNGMGMREGQGRGPRPEQRTDVGTYDSKVKSNSKRGKAVIVGEVAGPNKAGDTKVLIQEQLEEFKSSEGDPLTGKRLPKAQRDHVREYISSVQQPE